jgi:hypothetical protein
VCRATELEADPRLACARHDISWSIVRLIGRTAPCGTHVTWPSSLCIARR